MADDPDDIDRDAIHARRRRFIALALAAATSAAGLAAGGAHAQEDAAMADGGPVDAAIPTACLSPPIPEDDGGCGI